MYAARRETNSWRIVQVSDWRGYRWNFGGGGSIVAEVNIGAVRPLGARDALPCAIAIPAAPAPG